MNTILNTLNSKCLPIAQITTMSGLKSAFSGVVGLLVMFAYVLALVIYFYGVSKKSDDPGAASTAIKTAAWLAAGTTVVTVIFAIFGLSGATITPSFN